MAPVPKWLRNSYQLYGVSKLATCMAIAKFGVVICSDTKFIEIKCKDRKISRWLIKLTHSKCVSNNHVERYPGRQW